MMGRLNQLTSEQLRACLLLVDEAIEFAGPESTQASHLHVSRLSSALLLSPGARTDVPTLGCSFLGASALTVGSRSAVSTALESRIHGELSRVQQLRGCPAWHGSLEDLNLLPADRCADGYRRKRAISFLKSVGLVGTTPSSGTYVTDVVEPPTLLQLRNVLFERFKARARPYARLRRVPSTAQVRPARPALALLVQKRGS